MTRIVNVNQYEEVIDFADQTPYKTSYYNEDNDYKIEVNRFERERVSEVFNEGRVKEMLDAQCGIFIDANMGSGKTTFILKSVLPEIEKRGKKMLFLCSRVALTLSVKKEAAKNNERVKEIVKEYNEYGMKKHEKFDVIDILTYHRFSTLSDEEIAEYGVVVMDEVHFFIEDADFNRDTKKIFDSIMKKCQHMSRIYMTATPRDIFDHIYEAEIRIAEKKNRIGYKPQVCLKLFSFKKDFFAYNCEFFEKDEQLIDLIANSDKKWLIFIDSKAKGENLKSQLKNKNIECDFFDAASKENDKSSNVTDMIISNEIKERVVMLTCAFDVGININTSDICIAMFAYTRTRFLQELGRKRLNTGEYVNVYIHIPEEKFIQKRCNGMDVKISEIYNRKSVCYGKPVNGFEMDFPFYAANGKYEYNQFTVEKYSNDRIAYKEFLHVGNSLTYEDNFKTMVLKWMGKTYVKEQSGDIEIGGKLLKKEQQEKLLAIIHANLSKRISKEEAKKLCGQILQIADFRVDTRKQREGSTKAANMTLKLVGYFLRIIPNKGYYEIQRSESNG